MRDSLAAGKLEKGTEKTPNVKTGGGEMLISRISQPSVAFLTARNEISLLKEIYFLPQRRKFLAAKKFSGGWETGKNGASDGIFRLSGGFPRTKSCWLFVRHPQERLTRRRTWSAQGPVRTVRTEAEGGNPCHPAFPQRRENRAFPSAPRPSSVRAILACPFLTI